MIAKELKNFIMYGLNDWVVFIFLGRDNSLINLLD
jgi:hypothetical protein